MRLINTKTLKLEEFSEGSIPPYAILSHTWGNDDEELTFRDVENGIIDKPSLFRNGTSDGLALGSIKLRGCCKMARRDGLGYAWIDTCCIDKTNLVELSEAINSMFRWYDRAFVCYAYLQDVHGGDDGGFLEPGSTLHASRWFQRGWTLQELLAPKHLRFYNSEWRCIGSKGTLCAVIMNITSVPRQFLLGITKLSAASIAQRMSWAAKRHTKRAEDMSYCLLGIFGIAMPMIYGEGGEQAFFRLQEQIMRTTRDDSILAWDLENNLKGTSFRDRDGGVLAPDPSRFANSGDIVIRQQADNPLYSLDMSGGSLRIYLPLLTTVSGQTFGLLNCGPASNPLSIVGIPLAKATSAASNEYVRPTGQPSVLRTMAVSHPSPELVYIKREGRHDTLIKSDKQYWFYQHDLFSQVGLTLVEVEPPSCWDKQTNLISPINTDESPNKKILMRFRHDKEESQDFITMLETSQLEPSTTTCSRKSPLQDVAKDLPQMSSEESENRSARNEALQLRIRLTPAEAGIICIEPEAIVFQTEATIHPFESANLIMDFKRIMKESNQLVAPKKEFEFISKIHSERLRRATAERAKLEYQIKELEQRKRIVDEEVEDSTREGDYIMAEQVKLKDKEVRIEEQMLSAYSRLNTLGDEGKYHVGCALSQGAVSKGDIEVLRGIVAKIPTARDMMIAATKRNDVDTVRWLLVAGVKPDGKDDRGWSPLRWALGKKFGDVARLLVGYGARMDCQRTISDSRISGCAMALSHDSKLIAAGSLEHTFRIWDSVTGQLYQTMQGHSDFIWSVAFSHDSKLIASAANKSVRVWDTATGQCCQTLEDDVHRVTSVAFSHDSKLIASATYYHVKVLDAATGQCLHMLTGDGRERVFKSVAFSHNSECLIANGYIWRWDTATWKRLRELRDLNDVYTAAYSPDSRYIISGSIDGTMMICDSMTGKRRHTLCGHLGSVYSVAVSHDSQLIASGSKDGNIKIWNSTTGQCQQTLYGHSDSVISVAFSHDSTFLVSESMDKTIKIWDNSMWLSYSPGSQEEKIIPELPFTKDREERNK